jgi:N-formylmaleamate deformylase
VDALGERLHVTLARLGVERPVLVGHSAGAITVSGYASAYPTCGVVNVDQPMTVAPFAALLQQLEAALRGPRFLDAFAPFERAIGVDRLPEPERMRVEATRGVHQDIVLDHWQLPLTTPPDRLQSSVDRMLDAITVPYLFLAGEPPPPSVLEHLRLHLPRLQVVVWPGAGHLVHLAEPDRFATLLADFAVSATRDSAEAGKR